MSPAPGFPLTPTGSPGGVEDLAMTLIAANTTFAGAASALSQTASGLSGVDWSGPAEARFSSAAHRLGRAAGTYHDTLADVVHALRSYAHALQTAQRAIEAARADHDAARAAQADAAMILSSLQTQGQHAADPHEHKLIAGQIDDQHAAAGRASTSAGDALARALKARRQFDDAQERATGVLSGTSPRDTNPFGAPGRGLTNQTAGPGILGGSFGVPAGGLGNLDGSVPMNAVGDLDGLAKSAYDDRHGQTEVSDLDNAIDVALLATGIGAAVKGGVELSKAAAKGLARQAAKSKAKQAAADALLTDAERTAVALERETAKIEAKATRIEKLGELGEKLGAPQGENLGKVVAVATHPVMRPYLQIQVRQAIERVVALRDSVRRGLATLRAAHALRQGVRSGIPKAATDRLGRIANDATGGDPLEQ